MNALVGTLWILGAVYFYCEGPQVDEDSIMFWVQVVAFFTMIVIGAGFLAGAINA